jgi:hypothetical protein
MMMLHRAVDACNSNFPAVCPCWQVWRVSWSVMGNILAVSQGDNRVSLWKEALDGSWKNLAGLAEGDQDDAKAAH